MKLHSSWGHLLAGAVLLGVGAGQARAATLTVTTTDDTSDGACDANCSLRDAITAANDETSYPGADTIVLASGSTYTVTGRGDATNFYGFNGLPVITSTILIQGNGATIERGSAGATSAFRLFAIARQDPATGAALTAPGNLTIQDVVLRGGLAQGGRGGDSGGDDGGGGGGGAGLGGAIYNQGTLSLIRSTLSGNTARGGAGGTSSMGADGDDGGAGGGGGLGGDGGQDTPGNNTDGGGGGGGFGGRGGNTFSDNGAGGGGSTTDGTGSSAGNLNGGAGGTYQNVGNPGGFGGGGGGGGDEAAGGAGGLGGGGGSTGESDDDNVYTGGAGGFGGGGGAGGEDNNGGNGGFGGGGGGASRTGDVDSNQGGLGGFGGGDGGGVLNNTNNYRNTGGGGGAGLGGAIFNDGGTLSVANCTFSGNSAIGGAGGQGQSVNGGVGQGLGGGIFARNGSISLDSVTLSDSAATDGAGTPVTSGGGALYLLGDGATVYLDGAQTQARVGDLTSIAFSVVNSILANTTGDSSDAFVNAVNSGSATPGTNSFNLVENNGAGGNALPGVVQNGDPNLGQLQNNGGLTPTLAISASSPASNTGGTELTTDQRGFARPRSGTDDIGAFQFNTVPVVSSVTIAPGEPKTNDLLTANASASDSSGTTTFTYTYQWNKNGQPLTGEKSKTLDLSKSGNGDKGDKITVTVTAINGTSGSAPVTSDAVTIQNSAPQVSAASIVPASPKTNDVLLIQGGTATDDDSTDTLTLTYQWQRNGSDIVGETGSTLDLSKADNGDKGDLISVVVRASDGTAISAAFSPSVTIVNSAPVLAGVTLQPAGPKTDDPLIATIAPASDADGDSVLYTYTWTRTRGGNAQVIQTTQGTTATSDTLQTKGSIVVVGDTITVSVVASDGTTNSASQSATTTIGNSPVKIGAITLSPTTPRSADALIANVQVTDDDGGRPMLKYEWSKTYNGRTRTILTTRTDRTQDIYDLSKPTYGNKGDTIILRVTADDGQGSTSTLSKSVVVGNTVPIITDLRLSSSTPTNKTLLRSYPTTSDIDVTERVDTLTYSYKWSLAGRFLPNESGPNLDLAKYSFAKAGDVVTLGVRASDGTALSASKEVNVTITGNTPKATTPSAGGA